MLIPFEVRQLVQRICSHTGLPSYPLVVWCVFHVRHSASPVGLGTELKAGLPHEATYNRTRLLFFKISQIQD